MLITIGLSVTAVLLAIFAVRSLNTYRAAKVELKALRKQIEPRQEEVNRLQELQTEYESLQNSYVGYRKEFAQAQHRISCYELGIGTVDARPYEPKSGTDSPKAIESSLSNVREQIKGMVKAKTACSCKEAWTVNNRKAGGTKLVNREVKLRLRCFDNACKSAISLVEWNNINRLKDRIIEAFHEINGSGDTLKVYLQQAYLDLRLKEFELKFELDELTSAIKEREKEERKIAREAEREEKRIKAAAEKATSERESHEELVAKELAKLQFLSGDDVSSMQSQIDAHKLELAKMREVETRAISMAQQTRAGYVYVISNRRSFGDGICKIGMTRRVNPQDRVKELGDASVPELFDVHAFIYSEDAPTLEKFLHAKFSKDRVNLVNSRKEFFFVYPEQVLEEVEGYAEEVDVHLPTRDGEFELAMGV